MENSDQNIIPEAHSPKDSPKPRMPFREVTIRPRPELRQRILEIQLKTGKTANVILEELLCTAAGMPIQWMTIMPKNGTDAGISLKEVEKALTDVFFAVRDLKGLVKSNGSREASAKIDSVVVKAMALWAHAQSLAKDTFYDEVRLVGGRRVFSLVSSWKGQVQTEIVEELRNGATEDSKVVQNKKTVIASYDAVLTVLSRLGFSPAGPTR